MYRNGQWVKFKPRVENGFPGAFRALDGRIVGIFCHGDYGSKKPFISVCDEIGQILVLKVDGVHFQGKIAIDQDRLEAVKDRRDIPPARISHLPKEWQPEA